MSGRRTTHALRCPKCKIHKSHCFCDKLVKHPTKTIVTFLMHHREEHLTSNTVNLGLMTLENVEVFLRGLPEDPFQLEKLEIDTTKTTPLFLFPAEDAIDLTEENLQLLNPNNLPIRLIVPDGTWSQAKKVYRRDFVTNNTTGLKIPAVKLAAAVSGNYQLRKSPREDGLSTFEAVAHALSVTEKNPELTKDLLKMFTVMVERMIKTRRNFHGKLED